MIRNIRKTEDAGIVMADGLKYDLNKVLDTGFRMINVLLNRIKMAHPLSIAMLRLRWRDDDIRFEAHHLLALKKYFLSEGLKCQVSELKFSIVTKLYYISFSPFGGCYLKKDEGTITTNDREAPEELNASPRMVVSGRTDMSDIQLLSLGGLFRAAQTEEHPDLTTFPQKANVVEPEDDPSGQCVIMSEDQADLAGNALASFGEEGVMFSGGGGFIIMKFSHTAFGDGEGPIRIEFQDYDDE